MALSWPASFIPLKVAREILRRLNIFRLGALITTSEKSHQNRPSLLKIDPVTRTIVDPKFTNSSRHGPNIASISADVELNPGLNQRRNPEIAKTPSQGENSSVRRTETTKTI